jgi:hypothetical protein
VRFGLNDRRSRAAQATFCKKMILFTLLTTLPSRMSHALLVLVNRQHSLDKQSICNHELASRATIVNLVPLTAQTLNLPFKATTAPTLTRWLAHCASRHAWLRAVLPVHPTSWLTPCLLPVAAHTDRENQHETHVIQRHPRRRNACSHC